MIERAIERALQRPLAGTVERQSGAVPYVGPLDLVSGAAAAFSQRAMSVDWVGNAIAIRKDGGATQDFTTATGNAVDVSAVETFLDGEDGFGVTHYDQSGSGKNVTEATEAEQPLWSANAIGGKPGLVRTASAAGLVFSAASSFPNGGVTAFIVSRKGTFSFYSDADALIECVLDTSPYIDMRDNAGNEAGGGYGGGVIPQDAVILVDFVVQQASKDLKVNGTTVASDSNYDSGDSLESFEAGGFFGDGIALSGADSTFVELLVYPSVLADADRTAVRENIATYYGITLS